MLDSGCTRSCVRKGEKFLPINLETSDLKIKCANNEIMDAAGTCQINPKFSNDFTATINPLVIENLSCPFIIGLDLIESLNFNKNSRTVTVNGHKLKLTDGFQSSKICFLSKSVTIDSFQEVLIPIKNVFNHPDPNKNILINNLQKQKASDEITITPAVYKNEDTINVLITNRSHKRIFLKKRKPICTMEISEIENCNGVQFLKNKNEEDKMVSEFQKKRREKAKEINFEPKIGSYGNMPAEKKSEIEKIVSENKMAFNMDSQDLGRLGHFYFTLPQHDETETAYQPPRAIPIHLKPKVDKELAAWSEMGIIEPTQSGNNIPLIILKKRDGSIRVS